MILSDNDIRDELEARRIMVSPPLDDGQVQPASLDLRMGDELVDVATGGSIEPADGTFRLHPWRFYIGATMDDVALPNDLTATIENRSTFARKGLIPHLAAGRVDPGWSGVLTLEMLNVSTSPVDIDVGERVVQLVFETLKSESSGYDGKYQGADGAMGAIRDSGGLPFDEDAYGMH